MYTVHMLSFLLSPVVTCGEFWWRNEARGDSYVGEGVGGATETIDPYDLLDPVNVLGQILKDFFTQVVGLIRLGLIDTYRESRYSLPHSLPPSLRLSLPLSPSLSLRWTPDGRKSLSSFSPWLSLPRSHQTTYESP